MKYIDEYRDADKAKRLAKEIHRVTTRPWTLMEICGGQTHAIVKFGIDMLLPDGIELVHGPGCPVCVTPAQLIDKAVAMSQLPDVILCSFGDMLRVPGATGDLLSAKSRGADVRIVYSPLDAVQIAREHPDRQVVFFAVGFETTAPANAMAVQQADLDGLDNFSILVSHVLVPPAMDALLSADTNRVQGFLAAGHVCTVMGYHEYGALARAHQVPMVVTGFEPVDILQGVLMCVRQLEEGRAEVENQYARSVTEEGNVPAQALLKEMFEIVDREWRGMGPIPGSGLGLRGRWQAYDAERRFDIPNHESDEASVCISGDILQGLKKPNECPAFGTQCTPEHPLGATMVSNEGACAAYHRYRGVKSSSSS